MSRIRNNRALDANRKGRITLSQAVILFPLILVGVLLMGLAAFILVGVVASFSNGKGDPIVNAIVGGGLGIGFLWLGFQVGGKQLIDILTGQVRSMDGLASKLISRTTAGRALFFSVDKTTFTIFGMADWEALPDGVRVRAYYTPLSKSIVNVEELAPQGAQAFSNSVSIPAPTRGRGKNV